MCVCVCDFLVFSSSVLTRLLKICMICPYNYLIVEQLYNVHGHVIFPILGVKNFVLKSGFLDCSEKWDCYGESRVVLLH